DGLADIFRLIGAVDAVQGILVALVEIERPRPQRIGWTAGNARRVRAEPRLNLRRWDPIGPFSHAADRGDAGEGQRFLPHRHAVADRLAAGQHVVKITRISIDQDRAWRLLARIVHDMPSIGFWNVRPRIGWMGEQLAVAWGKIG